MRASVLRDGRMVLREDVAEPVPGPGQVLVGVKACGICGSDLHFAKHAADVLGLNDQIEGFGGAGGMNIDLNRDIFMGHEFSAEVSRRALTPMPRRRARLSRPCRCWCPPQGSSRSSTPTRRLAAMPSGCCCRRRC
jgi:hypothetical protein